MSRKARISVPSALPPLAALAVAAVAMEAMLSAATPNERGRDRLVDELAGRVVPSLAHLLALLAGLLLLVCVPSLWRGTQMALRGAVAALLMLAALNLVKGLDYEETLLDLALAGVLVSGRGAFGLGCGARPRLAAAVGVIGVWAAGYLVLLTGLLVSSHARTIPDAVSSTLGGHVQLTAPWRWALEGVLALALVASARLLHSLLRPAAALDGHTDAEHRAARAIVEAHGSDSLAPFILREDKAFHFEGRGVLAYRVLGETAVVSGDPVGPGAEVSALLESFVGRSHSRGWRVVVWGASDRHLRDYARLGLRWLHVGEEAFVDPASFSLDGRRMRKVRQSVHRIERRGWGVAALTGEQLDDGTLEEIDALQERWRARQRRVIGFAMGMGPWEAETRPGDLFLLGRDPDGELRAVMRFIEHPGGLSLDTMRRIGETPNGLNEALVSRALEVARERGVGEVSLNFAGFAHLMAAEAAELQAHRRLARIGLRLLGRRFQMERLVRFNDKFLPEWRPRFLIYDSRLRLPVVGLRVLQAEAYLRGPRAAALDRRWRQRPTLSPPPRIYGAG